MLFNLLFLTLSMYLRDHLQFASHTLPSYDALYCMWSDIGLEPHVAEELATLGLLYEHGHIWVRPELEGTELAVQGAVYSIQGIFTLLDIRP